MEVEWLQLRQLLIIHTDSNVHVRLVECTTKKNVFHEERRKRKTYLNNLSMLFRSMNRQLNDDFFFMIIGRILNVIIEMILIIECIETF